MPKERYTVNLSSEEMERLEHMTHSGRALSAREMLHALVLLHSNDNLPEEQRQTNRALADWLDISPTTVNQIRKTYATEGLDAALYRKTRLTPPVAAKLTGDLEAEIIAMAEGTARS